MPISIRLETMFNRCRKVPPSAKIILIDKKTHSPNYSFIHPRKENIVNMIELFNVTLAHHETTRITFELLSAITIEKACVE